MKHHIDFCKFKDYIVERRNQVFCNFRYVLLLYENLCHCEGQYDNLYGDKKCLSNESLGMVVPSKKQLMQMIENSGFDFDSSTENNPVASAVLKSLKNWMRKVCHVKLILDDLFSTPLDVYDPVVIHRIQGLRLHNMSTPDDFGKCFQIMANMEVHIANITMSDLAEQKINPKYMNALIWNQLMEMNDGCGFYLGDLKAEPGQLLSKVPAVSATNVFCHLFLVPLNLDHRYPSRPPPKEPDIKPSDSSNPSNPNK